MLRLASIRTSESTHMGAWFFAAILVAACSSDDKSVAMQIESLDQAIGGPVAYAQVGDYLLKNDKIAVVVERGRESALPMDVGGTVVDMDLNRPEAKYRSGNGLDLLGQLAPIANIQLAEANIPASVRITKSLAGAEVSVSAEAIPVAHILLALELLLDQKFVTNPEIALYNEYELRPGEQFLRVTTTVGFDVPFCPPRDEDGCNAECDDILFDDDCECPTIPARCTTDTKVITGNPLPETETRGLLDILLGDLPRPLGSGTCLEDIDCPPGTTCAPVSSTFGGNLKVCRTPDAKDPGVAMGDMLAFSGHLATYLPGTAFDAQSDLRRLFERGEDTLANPFELEDIYAIGPNVSYGYVPPKGKIFIPIFNGTFAAGITAAAACPHNQPGCLTHRLVRFERWISVGGGDATSAREPFLEARGTPFGIVTGTVLSETDGAPVHHARIFALHHPDDLPCTGACETRCSDVTLNADPRDWTLDQLFEANRCRTQDDTYLNGHAGIDTYAQADLGTDPVHDGNFRLALRPGRYILVAHDGLHARSKLLPVTVTANSRQQAALFLSRFGQLSFRTYGKDGKLLASRATIGRCLAKKPCENDSECDGGDTCQVGACACARHPLLPREFGGSNNVDGIDTFKTTVSGEGVVKLPPGSYEVMLSHGPHFSTEHFSIEITAGRTTSIQATLIPMVNRSDWTAADFHSHQSPSIDSDTDVAVRLHGFVAEDMNFVTSTDHDTLTNFQPLIEQSGLSKILGSQIGVEVSTLDFSHYIGFPLKYREWKDGQRLIGNGAPNWRPLHPAAIFQALRDLGDGKTPVFVSVPHAHSYFGDYRLDPLTLEPQKSLLVTINPKVDPNLFSGGFDGLELVNGNSMHQIHRATIGEIRNYRQEYGKLLTARRNNSLSEVSFAKQTYDLSMETVRSTLHRTRAEQAAALAGIGTEAACVCAGDGDCAAGLVCDTVRMTCRNPNDEPGTGTPPPPEGVCRTFQGVVDTWFSLLNSGVTRVGLSGTDIHGDSGIAIRTLLHTKSATGTSLDSKEILGAIRQHAAIVTNGPMIHFRINNEPVGQKLKIGRGQSVSMTIRVEKADWYDVDRIEVYRNGELIHWASGCDSRRAEEPDPDFPDCFQSGSNIVVFDEALSDTPPQDSWYVVMAKGIDGRTLAPVYESIAQGPIGTFEITQRIFDIIPILRGLKSPTSPHTFPIFPFAITNPIWVDVGADGFRPVKKAPSWANH